MKFTVEHLSAEHRDWRGGRVWGLHATGCSDIGREGVDQIRNFEATSLAAAKQFVMGLDAGFQTTMADLKVYPCVRRAESSSASSQTEARKRLPRGPAERPAADGRESDLTPSVERIESEYRKLRRHISRLYSGYTPVPQIERLLDDLEIARQNELRKLEVSR